LGVVTQLDRSKNMNSSAFSWPLSWRALHSVGNTGLAPVLRTVSWAAVELAEDTWMPV
jgi:hypothetical protein